MPLVLYYQTNTKHTHILFGKAISRNQALASILPVLTWFKSNLVYVAMWSFVVGDESTLLVAMAVEMKL